MKFNEVLQAIESTEFAVQTNFVSGYKSFFRAVCSQESARILLKKLLKSVRQRHMLLSRINQLSRRKIDLEYENPWDAALATYLHILSLVDLDLAEQGASSISETPNCWWAAKLAHHILNFARAKETKSSTSVNQYELKDNLAKSVARPVKSQAIRENVRVNSTFEQQGGRSSVPASIGVHTASTTIYTSHSKVFIKASRITSKEILMSI